MREILLMGYGIPEDSKISKSIKRETFDTIVQSPATSDYDEFVAKIDSQSPNVSRPVSSDTKGGEPKEKTENDANAEEISNSKNWFNKHPIVTISIIVTISLVVGFICARLFK